LYDILVDINECMTGAHNCHSNAICADNVSSFTCQCKDGYRGDGVACAGQFCLSPFIQFRKHLMEYGDVSILC